MGHHGELHAEGGIGPLDPRQIARARAWLTVALIPLAPGGTISPTLLAVALARLAEHPACGSLPHAALSELATLTLRNISIAGPSTVLTSALPHLSAPDAETALCHAARIARQRGNLSIQSATLLDVLADRLGVLPEKLAAILEVTAMLDRV